MLAAPLPLHHPLRWASAHLSRPAKHPAPAGQSLLLTPPGKPKPSPPPAPPRRPSLPVAAHLFRPARVRRRTSPRPSTSPPVSRRHPRSRVRRRTWPGPPEHHSPAPGPPAHCPSLRRALRSPALPEHLLPGGPATRRPPGPLLAGERNPPPLPAPRPAPAPTPSRSLSLRPPPLGLSPEHLLTAHPLSLILFWYITPPIRKPTHQTTTTPALTSTYPLCTRPVSQPPPALAALHRGKTPRACRSRLTPLQHQQGRTPTPSPPSFTPG